MDKRNRRWDGRIILLHWLTTAAVLLAFATIWTRELLDDRALRATLLGVHRSAGLLALGLTLCRLALRSRVAAPPQAHPRLQALAAWLTHAALYLLMVAQPLFGWAYSSARGQPVLLLGSIPVPPLPGLGRDMAEALGAAHEAVGMLFLAVVGLHAAAALYHAVLKRDGVVAAMLPRLPARRA